MSLTPEQQQKMDSLISDMGFIRRPHNINQNFQMPTPIIVEEEEKITDEQHKANQESIAQILRARGYRHPNSNDHA